MAQALAQGPVDTGFWGTRAAGVAALERELARLRRAQTAHAREQGRTIARASVLNLVVYAEREVHARRAALSISELSLRHPSRAIVLLADRGAREGVEGRIDMHCHLPSADSLQQVCYEQILLRARGDSDERLASAVIPLLVPDLPVFLWWTGNPPFGLRQRPDKGPPSLRKDRPHAIEKPVDLRRPAQKDAAQNQAGHPLGMGLGVVQGEG